MKTPKEMAEEFSRRLTPELNAIDYSYRTGLYEGFRAGYTRSKHDDHLTLQNKLKKIENKYQNAFQWISVKDRLPAVDTRVLVYEDGVMIVNAISSLNHRWDLYDNGENCRPTHWMPLPKPPEK